MQQLFSRLRSVANKYPQRAAINDLISTLCYADLLSEMNSAARLIGGKRTGILLKNSTQWIICDLALLSTGTCCIPLPEFFSNSQLEHIIRDAGIEQIITDQPDRLKGICTVIDNQQININNSVLALLDIKTQAINIPTSIVKITYTSGTTGSPKGVCLSASTLNGVLESLAGAAQAAENDVSLSLLPLSTLLENIGGVYVPLLVGASCNVPGPDLTGISGSSGLDINRFLGCISRANPTSMILIPQLLHALVIAAENGYPIPGSLRFVAVGGARTSPHLLARAQQAGIPVYEGYGLSEAGSVVCLNTPGQCRPGTVGKPLPHVAVSIENGEVIVEGKLFCGYLHSGNYSPVTRWATGDSGYLDADGYLHLDGRKRDIYSTAYGRNIDPAWVENELVAQDVVLQVVVIGEAMPFNTAIVVPRPGVNRQLLQRAISAANARLPDYARISEWLLADEPFTTANGQMSAAGHVQRKAVASRYADAIAAIYKEVVTA